MRRPPASLTPGWPTSTSTSTAIVSVQAIEMDDGGTKQVRLSDGQSIPADIVIVATGVQAQPGTLVRIPSIATDHGILVDDQLQTNVAGIYAAGDVAQGPVRFGSQREVHAIQPTAVDHGRVAGANMAGQSIRYPGSLSMNVLDVCGLQCASFGDWQDPQAEAFTIVNPRESIYRSLHWTDDRVTGAIFVGRASNLGMLTDVGMVKGLIQTATSLGQWKQYLRENPFDIRRAVHRLRCPTQVDERTPARATLPSATVSIRRPSRSTSTRRASSLVREIEIVVVCPIDGLLGTEVTGDCSRQTDGHAQGQDSTGRAVDAGRRRVDRPRARSLADPGGQRAGVYGEWDAGAR